MAHGVDDNFNIYVNCINIQHSKSLTTKQIIQFSPLLQQKTAHMDCNKNILNNKKNIQKNDKSKIIYLI